MFKTPKIKIKDKKHYLLITHNFWSLLIKQIEIATKTISLLLLISILFSCKTEIYKDVSFYSEAFQTDRLYRIYLPTGYHQNPDKRYPVIYYFHGFGGRYKWDAYDLKHDINYPENGRKEPPFVMEWKNYVEKNEVIIVTWDGYEPNLNEGKHFREGIKYGNCKPYDFIRAHDMGKDGFWGWDYRIYFRELVNNVDEHFRTVADRNHRAVTGLSMGGLTSYYIAGQNKDLVGSASAFDPADNLPYYGPKNKQVVFPILEMYRSLKGIPVRLTMTDGDWLKYNDWELKRIFDASNLSSFEFHFADYPDHWAGDADKQLDFHMQEFNKKHAVPNNWNHVCPAYSSFKTWGYSFNIERSQPAITLLENVTAEHIKILSRTFIPDGPIIQDETISIKTSNIYSPSKSYQLITYNLTSEEIKSLNIIASADGKLAIELGGGGGHIIGINGDDSGVNTKLRIVQNHNKEYHYFEIEKSYGLDFKLVNLGNENAENIEVKAFSPHPFISFEDSIIKISNVNSADFMNLKNQFNFSFSQHTDSSFVGTMFFEVKINGAVADTQKIMFFTTPKSPSIINKNDVIILDGRTVRDIPIFSQGPNIIEKQEISGGSGNGNGILERGEDVLVYIKLPKGMAANDTNTFHRTYLLNYLDEPFIEVNKLQYEERLLQASKTHTGTIISIAENTPIDNEFDLWFKIESLYNDKNDPVSRATIYAHKYDFRRVKLKINED